MLQLVSLSHFSESTSINNHLSESIGISQNYSALISNQGRQRVFREYLYSKTQKYRKLIFRHNTERKMPTQGCQAGSQRIPIHQNVPKIPIKCRVSGKIPIQGSSFLKHRCKFGVYSLKYWIYPLFEQTNLVTDTKLGIPILVMDRSRASTSEYK